jgi:hypothetical protein
MYFIKYFDCDYCVAGIVMVDIFILNFIHGARNVERKGSLMLSMVAIVSPIRYH